MPPLTRKNLGELKRQLGTVPGLSLNRWSFRYNRKQYNYRDITSFYAGHGVAVTFKDSTCIIMKRGQSTLADML